MNNAMKTLAELLDIDHAKLPREMMAEKSCEATLNKIGGDATHIKKLAENIANLQNEREELISKNADLLKALKKAQEDVNWMTNSQELLNRFFFNYIDEAIAKAEGVA